MNSDEGTVIVVILLEFMIVLNFDITRNRVLHLQVNRAIVAGITRLMCEVFRASQTIFWFRDLLFQLSNFLLEILHVFFMLISGTLSGLSVFSFLKLNLLLFGCFLFVIILLFTWTWLKFIFSDGSFPIHSLLPGLIALCDVATVTLWCWLELFPHTNLLYKYYIKST